MSSLALLCYWPTLLHIFNQKRCQWTDPGLFQMLSLTCSVFLSIFPFLCYLFTTGKRCSKQQNCKKNSIAMQEKAHQGYYVRMLVSLTTASLLRPMLAPPVTLPLLQALWSGAREDVRFLQLQDQFQLMLASPGPRQCHKHRLPPDQPCLASA